MSVTVKDVARAAGVSTATVSRALRGFPSVDPAIRAHVLAIAQGLDYVGSPAAAALSTGRTNSIAIITPYVARWSFARMLSGVDRVLRTTNMDLLLYRLGDPSDPHPVPAHRRLRHRVDGFLVMSIAAGSPDLDEILRLNMPVTLVGSTRDGVASVSIDDRAGARAATNHLLDQGHTKIGLIYGRERTNPLALEHQRYLGFADALRDADVAERPEREASGMFTLEGGAAAMRTLLELPEPPTAVFAMSDEMAFGAMRAMRIAGVRPGHDIALIGFAGHELADGLDLSTIAQPLEELGALAVQNILDDIAQPDRPRLTTVLPTELVVRGSTSPIRHA